MPKPALDAKQKPLCITSLLALEREINESAFTHGDIVNVSIEDLHILKTALEFFQNLNGHLLDIRRAVGGDRESQTVEGLPPMEGLKELSPEEGNGVGPLPQQSPAQLEGEK